jgi:hypothetical protein
MNLLPTSLSPPNAMDAQSASSTPVSLSERVGEAMQKMIGDDTSRSPGEAVTENPFLWQFIEWMFYGEPEETGMETLEPHV